MSRTSFMHIEKLADCVRAYSMLSNLDCYLCGGQGKGFWKELKHFEKSQKAVVITARKYIIELPTVWKEFSHTVLQKHAEHILSFLNEDGMLPYFSWWIRTANENDNNFHMIILLSERTRATEFVTHRNDVYYNFEKKRIGKADDGVSEMIASKGAVKLDDDGYPVKNTKAFGIKLSLIKSKKWFYGVLEKLAALFTSTGNTYLARPTKDMITCSRYKDAVTSKQKTALFGAYVLIAKVKKRFVNNQKRLEQINESLQKCIDIKERITLLEMVVRQ